MRKTRSQAKKTAVPYLGKDDKNLEFLVRNSHLYQAAVEKIMGLARELQEERKLTRRLSEALLTKMGIDNAPQSEEQSTDFGPPERSEAPTEESRSNRPEPG